MSITNFDFLNREVDLFTNARDEIDQSSNFIQKTIEENTVNENEAVKNAIEALNKKVEAIIQSEPIKQERQKIESNQKVMSSSLDKAKQVYFKVCDIIQSKNLGEEKTIQMQNAAYSKIIKKFISPQEMKMFEQLVSMGPNIMIISNNRSLGHQNMLK